MLYYCLLSPANCCNKLESVFQVFQLILRLLICRWQLICENHPPPLKHELQHTVSISFVRLFVRSQSIIVFYSRNYDYNSKEDSCLYSSKGGFLLQSNEPNPCNITKKVIFDLKCPILRFLNVCNFKELFWFGQL